MVRAFLVAGAARLTNTASYAAWFRNNGTWFTKTVGHKCWNTELIENANVVLGPQWTSLDEKIATGIQWYLTMVTNSMNNTTENATSTCCYEAKVAPSNR
jgi:hypothetical protein